MFSFPKLDQFEFHHVMEETAGTSLVIFTSHACNSCRAWKQLLHKYRQQAPWTQVFEVDAEQEMALTREFEVFHLPSLFVFRDGDFFGELQCEASTDAIAQGLHDALAQPAREMP